MLAGLEAGIRHIDTGFIYQNEEAIGKVLKKWLDKGGKREDLFITTKVSVIYLYSYDKKNSCIFFCIASILWKSPRFSRKIFETFVRKVGVTIC